MMAKNRDTARAGFMSGRKTGAEHVIMIRLPADRVRPFVPAHLKLAADQRSRVQVALLVQKCDEHSFGEIATGQSMELHLWCRLEHPETEILSDENGRPVPEMHWYGLGAGSTHPVVVSQLHALGFPQIELHAIELHESSGVIAFQNDERIEWRVADQGGTEPVHINHFIHAGPQGGRRHEVSVFVADAAMDQPGRVRVSSNALEPFLMPGERFAAVVHSMSGLEAAVWWQDAEVI